VTEPVKLPPRRPDRSRVRHLLADGASRFGLVVALLVIVATFSAIKPSTYFTSLNFETIATNQAPTLLLALAVLLPLIGGEFDLSVAANFGFCQLLAAGLIVKSGLPWGLAVLATLAVGTAIGLANGVLIAVVRINSFIATLGMSTLLDGLNTQYSGGATIQGDFPDAFLKIGSIQVLGSLSIFVVYALVVALVLWIALSYSPSGRHLYATGGARNAAQLMGLRTRNLLIGSFVLCGFIAAIAGIVTASQLTSGQPSLGASYLLPAYAAAFLGATTVIPGQFNIWGTVIGTLLLGAGVTGLQQLGMASYVQDYFNGGALLIAVAASGYVTRRRRGGSLVRIPGLRRRARPAAPADGADAIGDDRPEVEAPVR
jgi:ribose transport system permease protein